MKGESNQGQLGRECGGQDVGGGEEVDVGQRSSQELARRHRSCQEYVSRGRSHQDLARGHKSCQELVRCCIYGHKLAKFSVISQKYSFLFHLDTLKMINY